MRRTVIGALAALPLSCQNPALETDRQSAHGFVLPDGDADRGREAFVALRCSSCHEVSGLERDLPAPVATPVSGEKLGGLAMREPTDGELVSSIVNPSHQLYPRGRRRADQKREGSRMGNLNASMSVQDLIDMVAFLHERYETAGSKRQE
jgi:hypothetical protein